MKINGSGLGGVYLVIVLDHWSCGRSYYNELGGIEHGIRFC